MPLALDQIATRGDAPQPSGAEMVATPDAYEGAISRVVGTSAFAIIPAFSVEREHGPGILIAPAGVPSVGDTCYVLFADTRIPIILVPGVLRTGSKTFDWPSVADNAISSTTVTVTGAALGMFARANMNVAVPAGVLLSASVIAADTVAVTLLNRSGGAVDLASGTLTAAAFR